MDLSSVLFFLMHISLELGNSSKYFMNSESFIFAFLIKSHSFLLLG